MSYAQNIKQQGFSLIEILISLSIAAIVVAFAVPSYQFFLNRTQYHIMSSQLLRAIQLARIEAITRHTVIQLCKSSNQKTCSGDWIEGYIIQSEESLLYSFRNVTHQGILKWRAALGRPELKFFPSGETHAENGAFWFCAKGSTYPVWAILLNKKGQTRLIESQDILSQQKMHFECKM